MGKQEYLSAGRFAALVGTTKETLFHYDEIGLFVPKRREANGLSLIHISEPTRH